MTFDPTIGAKKDSEDRERFAPVYFGKLTLTQIFRRYPKPYDPNSPSAPEECTEAEWRKTPERQRILEWKVEVDGSAFNPDQRFVYERKVTVGGAPRRNPDWYKIFVPSVAEVFGGIEKLRDGVWVCVEDAPQIRNPEYNCPKFRALYPDEPTCAAAWRAQYAATPSAGDLESARKVWNACGNKDTFKTIIEQDPLMKRFGADALLAALGIE